MDDGAGSAAEAYDPPAFIADFSHLLFEVAGDHFDPHGQHLIWTQGFTGGYHPANPDAQPREYSRKFGWEGPHDPGEGLVYVGVGTGSVTGHRGCGHYDSFFAPMPCEAVVMPDGTQAEALIRIDRREIHRTRADGSYVFAIVDTLFGNNSEISSNAPLPSLEQLTAFVMDPRLVLPTRKNRRS